MALKRSPKAETAAKAQAAASLDADRGHARAVGKRIRTLLDERGWKQQELAAKAGVDAGVLSRYMNGKRNGNIGVNELARISRTLDVSLSWLYEEVGPRERGPAFDAEVALFEWPAGTPESIQIAVHRMVLAERTAHREALVPFWHFRMRRILETLTTR